MSSTLIGTCVSWCKSRVEEFIHVPMMMVYVDHKLNKITVPRAFWYVTIAD